MLERGTLVRIKPGTQMGFQTRVSRSPSFVLRAVVLGRVGESSLLVVTVERRGRAVVDARDVTEVRAEMPGPVLP